MGELGEGSLALARNVVFVPDVWQSQEVVEAENLAGMQGRRRHERAVERGGSVMWFAPVVMIRNEEYVIGAVLEPLCKVFEHVYVGDTGSTDKTCEIARGFSQVVFQQFGMMRPRDLAQVRWHLAQKARSHGYEWAMMVDGDELYTVEGLRQIVGQQMQAGKRLGYTVLISVDRDEKGQFWLMDDKYNRTAVFRTDEPWVGEYPFEGVKTFWQPETFQYFDGDLHGYNLHRLVRSPMDGDVYMRSEKRLQYCLADMPQIKRVEKVTVPGLS